MSFLCLLFFLFSLVLSKDLVDDPIVGDTIQYLDGQWQASNSKTTIPATVPGDLITDLQRAKLINDPLYETTWIDNSDLWDNNDWTYSINFMLQLDHDLRRSVEEGATQVYLVFDGIKMGAYISLNGVKLGNASDQFLRYSFAVTPHLSMAASNILTVTFPAKSAGIDCQGRYMACTGGWDWAPYSNTRDQHGSSTLSKGIWKSVYLVSVSTAGITHVVPQIFYRGTYPTSPLTDTTHGPFDVDVYVHLLATGTVSGTVKVAGDWGAMESVEVNTINGESVVKVSLKEITNVKLWWPVGLGAQNMYQLTVSWVPQAGKTIETTRRIGFRTFALVTGNDTDPSTLSGKDGSGSFTMRFKINGANLFSKGANMIPMEEYEGRASADAFRYLVLNSKDGNFNTLRIWGGGIYFYDAFYDACDELGLLVYHDVQYAQGGHSPTNTPIQEAEIRHQVRRLSHHPSIVIWDGCNECDGQGLYSSFVMTTLVQEDKSRPVWPSCPARGWDHGVDTLWGLPNGVALATRTNGPTIETHGPYQHGNGFKAVDDKDGVLYLFGSNVPPNLNKPSTTGPGQQGIYASEFGCVAMSSYESMAPTLSPAHWSLHAPPMYQRNYPCDNVIDVYWGVQDLTPTGQAAFTSQLYKCLIGQALEMKSDIEVRRSSNHFGTLIWQLNEIWPTGGWGSIEYGTPVDGQVIGGRWKPLHHLLARSVYADVMATCGVSDPVQCYVKNDSPFPFMGTLTLSLVAFATGKVTTLTNIPLSLPAGAGITNWFCAQSTSLENRPVSATNFDPAACKSWAEVLAAGGCANASYCILTAVVLNQKGVPISSNELSLTTPQGMKLPKPSISWSVSPAGSITLQSNAVAVYVTLTTKAQGRFSDNVFLLLPGSKNVQFIPYGTLDLNTLKSTLRVEHAQMYQ